MPTSRHFIDGLRQHLRRLYRETSSSTDRRGWMGILGCHVFMTGVKETALAPFGTTRHY